MYNKMFGNFFGKPKEPSNPIPTRPKPKYVAPYILNKFPVLKEAVDKAMDEPRENYDVIRELEMSAAEKLGEVWNTASDREKKKLLDELPYKIVWQAQAYYGVPGGHTTAAEHGGRRRKTKKSKRRARKTRRRV